MADFTVRQGTDWIASIIFGEPEERWSLDDYNLVMQVVAAGETESLMELTLANGGLVIADARSRRVEINASAELMNSLPIGDYEFDILFINRTTELRSGSDVFTLSVVRGITTEA